MDDITRRLLASNDEDEFVGGVWSVMTTLAQQREPNQILAAERPWNSYLRDANAFPPPGEKREAFFVRFTDAVATLVQRGYLVVEPHSPAYRIPLSARGLTADAVSRGWPAHGITLARFPQVSMWADATMAAYFRFAVQTFEAGVAEAAVFFVGAASERLVERALDDTKNLTQTPLKGNEKAKEKVEKLFERLASAAKAKVIRLPPDELDFLENEIHAMRFGRNDVGHPKPTPPNVPRPLVAARLLGFSDVVTRLEAVVNLVK